MALAYDGFDIGLSSGNVLEFLSYNNHRTPKQIFTINQDTTNGNVALFTDGDSDVSAAQASVHIQTNEQDPSLLLNSENDKSPEIQLRSNTTNAEEVIQLLNDTSLDSFVASTMQRVNLALLKTLTLTKKKHFQ